MISVLNYYLSDGQDRLKQVDSIEKGAWIKMNRPTKEEIDFILDSLDIPLDFIMDALDNYERSRVERERGNILIIVDFPIRSVDNFDVEVFKTIPLGIIVTPDHFITVCLDESHILDRFLSGHVLSFLTHKKTRFCLQIMQEIVAVYLRDLLLLRQKNNELERRLKKSLENDRLYEIVTIEKSLIYFQSSLNATKRVITKMMGKTYLVADEADHEVLDDLLIEVDQVIEMVEIHSSRLSSMMDIYTNVMSNNMNDVMKSLTLFTIILTAPTLVFSFYGMNVPLPFMHSPYGWVITIVISAILSLIMGWYLLRKH